MTVYANLSTTHVNGFSSLWLENVEALVEVQPLKLGETLQPEAGDIVHLHWPDHYHPAAHGVVALFRLARFFLWLSILRAKKVRIFATIHNVAAHDRHLGFTGRAFWHLLPSFLDGIVVHASIGPELVQTTWPRFGSVPTLAVKHPTYPRFTGDDGIQQAGGRSDRELISAIGTMRPYKRVDQLVAAYRSAVEQALVACPLYLGGELGQGMEHVLRVVDEMLVAGMTVETEWRSLSLERLETIIDRSTLVAVTHVPSIASGSMVHVLSLGGFLLAPNSPFARELAEDFDGHVALYAEPLDANDLTAALEGARKHECVNFRCRRPAGYSWSEVAADHVRFYGK